MSVDSFKRKLTAILYCDVAGYSRLSGSDEEGTHRRVMALLDFASEQIGAAGGVVLRFSGDAILAEFDSAVAVVRAAASIQLELWQQNRLLEQSERVQIRIGVNIGDVIEDGTLDRDGGAEQTSILHYRPAPRRFRRSSQRLGVSPQAGTLRSTS